MAIQDNCLRFTCLTASKLGSKNTDCKPELAIFARPKESVLIENLY